jgi:hypothetical protein
MVHLLCDQLADSGEHRAFIEGSGVCIAKTFPTANQAEQWLYEVFHQMFRGHDCDLGCVDFPGCDFLAEDSRLEQLAGLPDLHRH